MLVYSEHDTQNRTTHFGKNLRLKENSKNIGLGNLSVALGMFETSYDKIAEKLPSFTSLCESRIL
jgi:hypothetical protein